MEMKLAHASALHDGVSSSEFACKSIDETPSTSVSGGDSSSESVASSQASIESHNEATRQNREQLKASKKDKEATDITLISDEVIRELERVQIVHDNVDESDDSQWVDWPERFLEMNGFRLSIDPGDFYKHRSKPYFYVKLPHRSKYEVVVANDNLVSCDLDLYIDGVKTNEERLLPGICHTIDSPYRSKFAFKCFRSQDVPSGASVMKGDRNNGLVKAVFTPQKERHPRGRTVSEPALDHDRSIQSLLDLLDHPKEARKLRSYTSIEQSKAVRSLDIKGVTEGVTVLQGKRKKKYYVAAPEMEVDVSKRVTLQLRLIASATEEVEATDEEAYTCEPPSIA